MGKLAFESRIGPAQMAPPFDPRSRPVHSAEGAFGIAQPMLAQLRHLDPGHDRDVARSAAERLPRRRGGVEPAEPAEQPGTLDEDPLLRPR